VRAFFDRYHERRPLLHKTITSTIRPDLLGIQESMVSGSGLDTSLQRALTEALGWEHTGKQWALFSDAGIVQSLKLGVEDTDFPPIVAKIFSCIISVQMFMLRIPVVSFFVASAPLFLETLREFVGNRCVRRQRDGRGGAWGGVLSFALFSLTFARVRSVDFDIWEFYYVTLGPFFGLSTLVHPRLAASRPESLVLMPPGIGMGVRKHLGSVYRVLITPSDPNCPPFWFVNIHYTHFTNPEGVQIRTAETERVLGWMKDVEGMTDGRVIIAGDHNTLMPVEPLFERMQEAGYFSAHLEGTGAEPKSTWPSGIKAK
jgi:hypothetical protein